MMKICEIGGGMEKIIRRHLLKKKRKKDHHRRFKMNEWKYSLIDETLQNLFLKVWKKNMHIKSYLIQDKIKFRKPLNHNLLKNW